MAEDMTAFEKPEDLCKWLEIKNSDVRLEKHEASLLFNYMEGHDYRLGFDGDKLLRQDVAEENGEIIPYSIDDAIDVVCEWNYELLQDATNGMANPKDFIDFCNYKDAYDSLKEDETKLDAMFVRTRYGRQTLELIKNIITEAGLVPADTEPKAGEPEVDTGREVEKQERVR